jgi:hypothetical protein
MTACDYCLSDCSNGSRSLGDEDCGPSRECFHVDLGGPSEGNHLGIPKDGDLPRLVPRVDIPRELAVVPVQAGAMTHSSSKSAGCRPGSTREQEHLSRSTGTTSRNGRANLRPEKCVITPGLPAPHRRRCQDEAAARFQWSRPEPGCSGNAPPRDAGAINHRGTANLGRAQESPRGRRGPTGRELRLPKAGVPLGTSRRDFPIHAGSLGPHRAHAQHSACGPGSPRQRAPSPRPSGPPRREGVPRLPPQAWGTLRQRGGSESLARTTWSAGFQPGHTTGVVPDPVPTPDYHHKVLGGDETGAVARGLSAGLPTGWNGR